MDLGTNKSLGPDGYSAEFLKKKNRNIIKGDIKRVFHFKSAIINEPKWHLYLPYS